MTAHEFPRDLLASLRHAPQRNVTSLNVEDDVKAQIDYLHAFWEMESGVGISQPDAVKILLAAAVSNPRVIVPPGFRERVLAVAPLLHA